MKKMGIVMLGFMLFAGTSLYAQRHKNVKATHTAGPALKHDYRDSRVLPATPPDKLGPSIAVPPEKGRKVMQEQVSSSGSVISTPVPPPRKVVITPAPPPPGNTGTILPSKR